MDEQTAYTIRLQRLIEAFIRGDDPLPYPELHHSRRLTEFRKHQFQLLYAEDFAAIEAEARATCQCSLCRGYRETHGYSQPITAALANSAQPIKCPRCNGHGWNYAAAYFSGGAECLLCKGGGMVVPIGENQYRPSSPTSEVQK